MANNNTKQKEIFRRCALRLIVAVSFVLVGFRTEAWRNAGDAHDHRIWGGSEFICLAPCTSKFRIIGATSAPERILLCRNQKHPPWAFASAMPAEQLCGEAEGPRLRAAPLVRRLSSSCENRFSRNGGGSCPGSPGLLGGLRVGRRRCSGLCRTRSVVRGKRSPSSAVARTWPPLTGGTRRPESTPTTGSPSAQNGRIPSPAYGTNHDMTCDAGSQHYAVQHSGHSLPTGRDDDTHGLMTASSL